jgi:glycosyltransferase involved in cell wall biosynthesis
MKQSQNKPFISIVIPVKNEAKYIDQCVQSLLGQDYGADNYECIFIDNDSTDETVNIIKRYLYTGIFRIYSHSGGTIASVRNFGASKSKSSILAFLDGDCTPTPNWLNAGLKLFDRDNTIGCVGFVDCPPEDRSTWVEHVWFHLSSSRPSKANVQVPWLSSYNMIMLRSVFDAVGGFNESLHTSEDADISYKISVSHKLILSDIAQVKHLDDPKTIQEFFLREVWRGKSGLRSLLLANNIFKEMISLFPPIIYLIGTFFLIIYILLSFIPEHPIPSILFYLDILFLAGLPILYVRVKGKSIGDPIIFLKACMLISVYLFARGLAVIPFLHRLRK